MPIEKRFIFSGSALAFAGRIRRPDDVFLKVAAPSHLPVTGGLSEAGLEGRETEPYHYKDVIRFSEAHSRAHGDFSDPHRAVDFTHGNHGHSGLPSNTSVQARLHRLRIDVPEDSKDNTPRRIFHAGLLDLHMESTSDRRNPISFRSLTAKFEGITLTTIANGNSTEAALTVHTATKIFEENDTKEKLLSRYAGDGSFRKTYAVCFHPIGTHLPGRRMGLFSRHAIPHADRGPIVATIVTKLEWAREAPEGTEIRNNRLSISGLGRIYFGEIILDENSRRVTLLRFELGSPNGGDASACEAATNGTPWPPHSK
jgi:hypothetical protein